MSTWSFRKRRSNRKVVLARRSDGLGQRLSAILNGLRLANLLDAEFRLTWPVDGEGAAAREDHSIVAAEDFFSESFLRRHRYQGDPGEGFGFPKRAEDLDDLRSQLHATPLGLAAPNRPLRKVVGPNVPDIDGSFAAEFDLIEFHPDVHAAMTRAREVPLEEGSVGIHLRAGDVLFGPLRTLNRFWDKCIPAPIARALIEQLRDDVRPVFVFGQDADLVRHLCEDTGAIEAETLRPGMSGHQQSMFDIVLMSRCERIIGARSGFAGLAANITGKSVEPYLRLISPEDGVDITRADLAKHGDQYHPLQRAFAWWAAYYRTRDERPYDEAVAMVSAAVDDDPDNPRARLRLASLHFEHGQLDLGHHALMDALVRDRAAGDELRSLNAYGFAWTRWDNRWLFDSFDRAIDAGLGLPRAFRAVQRARDNDAEGAHADVGGFRAWLTESGPVPVLAGLPEKIEASFPDQLELARAQPVT